MKGIRAVRILYLTAFLAACGSRDAAAPNGEARSLSTGDVSALGRLEPGRGVVSVGGQSGERVASLEVAEGQQVAAGDVLARLESHALRRAERDIAAAAVVEAGLRIEAETNFANTRIHEAEASIRLYEVELKQQSRDLERLRELKSADAVSAQQLEEQQLRVRNAELSLDRARAQRSTAEADLARARSAVGLEGLRQQVAASEARLALTVVRAPIRGRVLKILTYPGETIGPKPILELGDDANMYAVAEVYETDIARVKAGDPATVESEALAASGGGLSGKVEEVGWMIFKNDVVNIDPRADTDTRVVEVRVKLDDPKRAQQLTHHQVRVQIKASGGK